MRDTSDYDNSIEDHSKVDTIINLHKLRQQAWLNDSLRIATADKKLWDQIDLSGKNFIDTNYCFYVNPKNKYDKLEVYPMSIQRSYSKEETDRVLGGSVVVSYKRFPNYVLIVFYNHGPFSHKQLLVSATKMRKVLGVKVIDKEDGDIGNHTHDTTRIVKDTFFTIHTWSDYHEEDTKEGPVKYYGNVLRTVNKFKFDDDGHIKEFGLDTLVWGIYGGKDLDNFLK